MICFLLSEHFTTLHEKEETFIAFFQTIFDHLYEGIQGRLFSFFSIFTCLSKLNITHDWHIWQTLHQSEGTFPKALLWISIMLVIIWRYNAFFSFNLAVTIFLYFVSTKVMGNHWQFPFRMLNMSYLRILAEKWWCCDVHVLFCHCQWLKFIFNWKTLYISKNKYYL